MWKRSSEQCPGQMIPLPSKMEDLRARVLPSNKTRPSWVWEHYEPQGDFTARTHGTLTMFFPVSEIVRDKYLLFASRYLRILLWLLQSTNTKGTFFMSSLKSFSMVPLTGTKWKWTPLPRLYPSTLPYFSSRSWCAHAWLYFTAFSHHLSLMKKQLTRVSGKTHGIIL